jgi:SAM-dependent methyltransferase
MSYAKMLLDINIFATLHNIRGEVLDYGCGTAPYLEKYRSQVTGVTFSDIVCRIDEDLEFIFSDGNSNLPFGDEIFDTILCSEVLEHLSNPSALFSEFERILKPGGRIILSTPFMYPLHETPKDFFRFSPYAIEDYCKVNGVQLVKTLQVGNLTHFIFDLVDKGFRSMPLFRNRNTFCLFSKVLLTFTKKRSSIVFDFLGEIHPMNRYTLGYVYVVEKMC